MQTATAVSRATTRLLLTLLLCLLVGCSGSDEPAPVISSQPASTTAVAGTSATFSVVAQGSGLSYQWQRSTDNAQTWGDIAGATGAAFSTAALEVSASGTQYRVNIHNGSTTTSSAATLTVAAAPVAPAIVVQPADTAVADGATLGLSVTASGTALTYQWQTSRDGSTWTDIDGATTATLTIASVSGVDTGRQLHVLVRNSAGSVTSRSAVLTVDTVPAAPTIVAQPAAASVNPPQAASFSANVRGVPVPSMQWQSSRDGGATWADIAAATGNSYTTPATALADNGMLLRLHATNASGEVFSSTALLSVSLAPAAPSFSTSPADQAVTAPAAASFSVVAIGTPTPTLQWQLSTDGGSTYTNITGATASTYVITTTLGSDNDRRFRAVASNASGSVTCAPARLSVTVPPGFSALPGALSVGRAGHSATLLPSGLVLIAGGNSGSSLGQDHGSTYATAELYNPATQTFSPLAARMGVVREGHTATLLPTGLVLIAGGFDNQGSNISYSSAELFNPATGTFNTLGSTMRAPRSHHAATLLTNGQVLLSGGDTSGASAEVFDPNTGSFTLLPASLSVGRSGHSATLLSNGWVLVAGGAFRQADGSLALRNSAEMFDPTTQTFTALMAGPGVGIQSARSAVLAASISLSTGRAGHGAVLLPSGKVLLVGGFVPIGSNFSALSTAEVFDPATGTFGALAAVMTTSRAEQTATLMPDGKVLLVGGTTAYSAAAVLRSAEAFDALPPSVQQFARLPARLPTPLGLHAAVRLANGQVLITGGVSAEQIPSPVLNTAYLYNPGTQSFTTLPTTLRTTRDNHTATLLPTGLVLIAGGQVTDNGGDGNNTAELYDPVTRSFTLLASRMVSPRGGHAAVLLPNGKVLLAGGFNRGTGTLVSDAELFDPFTRTFSAVTGRMVLVSQSMTATLLPNGKVLLAGGSDHLASVNTAQTYDPATQTFSPVANTMTARRGGHSAAMLPNGKVLLMGGGFAVANDLSVSTIYDTAELFDPVTQTFTAISAQMTSPRFFARSVALGDGTVMVIGGGTKNASATAWTVHDTVEIFTP